MTDRISPEARSRIMSRIQGGWRKNRVEAGFHRRLVQMGVVHRMNPKRTPGHPDVMVYPRPGVKFAVFLDGCFWHACPIHFRPPKNPRPSWNHDLVEEERRRSERRARLGYRWIRIWEHELTTNEWCPQFMFELDLGRGHL